MALRAIRAPAVVLVIAALACGVLAACGGDDDTPAKASGVPDTKKPGVLLIGSDIPYVPFEYGDPPNYKGFDMDLMREVTKRLGVKMQVQKTPFDTIFRDLAQGRFDMVVSSVTITPERDKIVDFSLPYFDANQSLMVKKGSGIHSLGDLKGKRVGVQIGGTGEHYVDTKLPDVTKRTYDVIGDTFNALAAGQVDGVVNDFPSSKFAERQYSTLEVVKTIPTDEKYGLVFPQSSDPLRQRVNTILRELKRDGTLDRMYQKWFETKAPADVVR